jgi:hypothetical protein
MVLIHISTSPSLFPPPPPFSCPALWSRNALYIVLLLPPSFHLRVLGIPTKATTCPGGISKLKSFNTTSCFLIELRTGTTEGGGNGKRGKGGKGGRRREREREGIPGGIGEAYIFKFDPPLQILEH